MVSLTVADSVDQSEWHLPTYDPRNENKYHYKLHSLDMYFWTQHDALQFVNGVRRVVPASHVEVLDEPGPPPQPAPMSSVVQQLENVAISDPQYSANRSSSQRNSQGRVASAAPSGDVPAPPPPPANFAPMAYNPAAPAAPETIQHREKTPPPDEDPLNPLAVAVAYDYHKQPFTPGMPPPSQFPPGGITSPGLPPQGLTSPGLPPSLGSPGIPPPQFAAPPQHPGVQRAATMPVQPGMPSPGLASPYGSAFPGTPGMPPPPPQQTQSQPTPPTSGAGLPPPPPNSFPQAQYPYQQHQQHGSDYSVHQQLYRPSQAEMQNPEAHPFSGYQPKKEVRGRLEDNAGRLERGVSGMLKKFEKKFG